MASNKSPWLSKCDINDEHLIAISHGEGRFVCNEQLLNQLIDNGQIATQYVDLLCRPTMDMRYNPNGSVLAIEGITSRMAVSLARWATASAAASSSIRTSPVTNTSRSLRRRELFQALIFREVSAILELSA